MKLEQNPRTSFPLRSQLNVTECYLVDLLGLPSLKMVVIGEKAFSEGTDFNISHCDSVETIEIGDECSGSVQTFRIDELSRLKTLKIGKNSFTQKKNGNGNGESKSFHIVNCGSIETIDIGEFSFSDFAGQFELNNLPALRSLTIGSDGKSSSNFYYSSFVVQSFNLITKLSL